MEEEKERSTENESQGEGEKEEENGQDIRIKDRGKQKHDCSIGRPGKPALARHMLLLHAPPPQPSTPPRRRRRPPDAALGLCTRCPLPQFKRYTFMHNGGIPGFDKMKRQLLSLVGDEAYEAIDGTTDSEVWRHYFYFVLFYTRYHSARKL